MAENALLPEEPLVPDEEPPVEAEVPDQLTDEADPFTTETPADPNDPQYKYWQGAYTKTVDHYRKQLDGLRGEHKQFGDVLRNFYQSDEYALQVLRQRFPQLANRLSLDGTPAPSTAGTPGTATGIEQALSTSLGEDLAFLAPRIAPALEAAIRQAVEPLSKQTEAQQRATRQAEEQKLMQEMDAANPGWEAHVSEMEAMQQFLSSGALHHPKFGNRLALLYRLTNPDVARVEAARSMTTASRSRLSTGRPGRPAQPNIEEMVRGAKSSNDAFRLAAEAALREVAR